MLIVWMSEPFVVQTQANHLIEIVPRQLDFSAEHCYAAVIFDLRPCCLWAVAGKAKLVCIGA
jgi:hypothetical protein